MPSDLDQLAPRAATVFRVAESLGFALVGIAPAQPSEHAEHIRQWLAAGRHGEMDYLDTGMEQYLDPRVLVPGAKAVICVADRYAEGTKGQRDAGTEGGTQRDSINPFVPSSLRPSVPSPSGLIARYAQGDDYHHVIKARLHSLANALAVKWPAHVFRSAVDTAPLLEREHAARAGLGWIGKHTLLIHPQLGSWLLLGEIVTTLAMATSAEQGWPLRTAPPTDHCGACTRCIDACPTQCITPYSIDASRCISYLTIEHQSAIDPELHEAMGQWIAGCDVCQEVCPFNGEGGGGPRVEGQGPRVAAEGGEEGTSADESPLSHADKLKRLPSPDVAYAPRMPALPLLEVLNWSEADRRAAVVRSSLKRIKLEQFKRNALIAAGNHLMERDDPSLLARIRELAEDADESQLVRLTAKQVLERLHRLAPRR
ncbi:MAG: tRNA epoxyqueuosine(34) reductase QueG [Phycisphaeraceae bacterium]